MSSKEDNSGLLSKVVKFVKNPTTNWGDLDQQESDRESSYSKQMLKEMIERRQRNDFVRRREFDMLRKLRQREAAGGPAATPSSFNVSSTSGKTEGRALTLKKIEQSIQRIDAGDYGYCDETGEPIGVGRLLARPTATLSLEAQQRRELKQKMFGD